MLLSNNPKQRKMKEEIFIQIVPIYDGNSTAVTQYKVIDMNGNMIFTGTYDECKQYYDAVKLIS